MSGLTSRGWNSRRRLRLRVSLLAGVEYVATCAFLLVYWWMGRASGPTTIALFAYSVVANALILAAIASGWSERLKDPSMTAFQMGVSCVRDIAGCYLMPGVWFVFAFNLFVALPFGSLQFTDRLFAGFWLATCAGLGVVFLGYPERLEIGFATPLEKFVLWLFLAAALARLMLFNARISALRRKLRAKAVELAQAMRRMRRERVSRELHDAVLQTHLGLVFQLTAMAEQWPRDRPERARIERAVRDAEQALALGREQVLGARLADGATSSLAQALHQAGEDLAYDTGLAFRLHVGGHERALSSEARAGVEVILFQALANAFHHSQGRDVRLELDFQARALVATVTDDGLGMAAGFAPSGSTSRFGVAIMRSRAESLGAQFSIEPGARGGTRVRLVLAAPLAYDPPAPPARRGLARAWRGRAGR